MAENNHDQDDSITIQRQFKWVLGVFAIVELLVLALAVLHTLRH